MKHVDLACVCEVEYNLIKELDIEFVDEVKYKNVQMSKIQFVGQCDILWISFGMCRCVKFVVFCGMAFSQTSKSLYILGVHEDN
jgi:hypothetical protein